MTVDELIAHLESIKETHGGDVKVESRNECGSVVSLRADDVYTYTAARTKALRVIIDAF
jgi:hypothetical protein